MYIGELVSGYFIGENNMVILLLIQGPMMYLKAGTNAYGAQCNVLKLIFAA